jgi:Helix-turn-helix domain of resolvase
VIIEEQEYIEHYGTPRHSGRYPWGSHGWGEGDGETTSQRNPSILDYIDELKKDGLTEREIQKGMGITSTQYRALKTNELAARKQQQIIMVQGLRDKGNSTNAISKRTGIPESTVRTLLAPGALEKAKAITNTADMLQRRLESPGVTQVDVGHGTENYLNISKEKLRAAVAQLEAKGFVTHTVSVPQLAGKGDTKTKVLCPPGTTWGEANRNRLNTSTLVEHTIDGGLTFTKIHPPLAINSNRVGIRYGSEGGGKEDGIIYVRPGVKDVSLGGKNYAQVRIQVGDSHFLKGMAMYKDALPTGTDILFNTVKEDTGNKFDAMKKLSDDSELPFGSVIARQVLANEGTKDEHVTSAMNIVREEGQWKDWEVALSSQFLSKQSPTLARDQLSVRYERSKSEFDDIKALTNPTIKKKLLDTFADSTDSSANHLSAAALSARQAWHVILPLNSLKPTEVFAPRFRDGERVALVRFPHGGTFEIPQLTVNNKNREGRRNIGIESPDAIGIHHSVAQTLSGADFDGDTVLVIPNNNKKVQSSPALEGLKDFEPRVKYKAYPGMKVMTDGQKQTEMGKVTNLITDMTIRGASNAEIARAIRHSMVVIDAVNHELNWKQSELDNGIKQLKQEYQGGPRAGASTLLSRAGAEARLPEKRLARVKEGGPIDLKTGAQRWVPTGKTWKNKKGEIVLVRPKSTQLAETQDAHTLSSGTPMEKVYADHANRMKTLANQARLESFRTPNLLYSPSANKAYASEVASLTSKLATAEFNAPIERQANRLAGIQVKAKRAANPYLSGDTLRKIKFSAIEEARARLGANKKMSRVEITPNEWDAIQAGAISDSKLKKILNNTDLDAVRKYATPRRVHLMTPGKINRARAMLSSGAYTRAQVADILGVSLTTLDRGLKGE